MRKLYIKVLVLIMPIILYFVMFLAFDANDFSGLRHSFFNNINDIIKEN